ncbi:MAG TPA: hypothetical protein VF832_13495 [Longimicrobiales bacterium]
MKRALLLALLLHGAGALEAQQQPIFFHPEQDYGSAAVRTPADAFVNRAFSVLVFDYSPRELGRIHWSAGWAAVRDALAHPGAAVDRAGGLNKVLRQEFLPSGGHILTWAWAPNYAEHVVAGGITYRYMSEWLDAHGVPAPHLAAGVVYVASMVGNEMMEMPGGPPGISGTVADLLVFDPAGMVLFSFDAPSRFFAHTLEAADWSPMPGLAFPHARLMNFGQTMSYKVPLPLTSRVRVLFLIGEAATTGLRVALRDDYHLSAATGFETRGRTVDPATGRESIDVAWSGELYLDRRNSLLVSIQYSDRVDSGLQVNVFPGVLPGVLHPAGIWLGRSRQGQWNTGLAFRRTLGLGLGADFVR